MLDSPSRVLQHCLTPFEMLDSGWECLTLSERELGNAGLWRERPALPDSLLERQCWTLSPKGIILATCLTLASESGWRLFFLCVVMYDRILPAWPWRISRGNDNRWMNSYPLKLLMKQSWELPRCLLRGYDYIGWRIISSVFTCAPYYN